jgi:hypothetical protein
LKKLLLKGISIDIHYCCSYFFFHTVNEKKNLEITFFSQCLHKNLLQFFLIHISLLLDVHYINKKFDKFIVNLNIILKSKVKTFFFRFADSKKNSCLYFTVSHTEKKKKFIPS